jgi:hypothetical protein
VIATAAVRFSRASAREARRTNEFPALLELLRDYRRLELDRAYIVIEFPTEFPDPSIGIKGLPPETRARVLRVSHFLDQLGLLVHLDLADLVSLAGYMGNSILRIWSRIGPFIYAEEDLRGEPYQRYFEALAHRVLASTDQRMRSYEALDRLDPSHPALTRPPSS